MSTATIFIIGYILGVICGSLVCTEFILSKIIKKFNVKNKK